MEVLTMILGLIKDTVFKKIENIILGIFAIIPQVIYFLYTSVASLLDVCQMLIRKLAGLDVYYVANSTTGQYTEKQGDILKEFIEGILGINKQYSALSTVFWALVIFAVIVLVIATILAIIKAQYNYDSEKSSPMKIIGNSLKSLATIAITPLIVLFGVYLNGVVLSALDSITSPSQNTTISQVYENDAISNIKTGRKSGNSNEVYYASYDMYGFAEWTNATTVSGMLFEIMASSSNRVRLKDYSALTTAANNKWESCNIFYSTTDDINIRTEEVATQIDYAFKNCLRLNNPVKVKYDKTKSEATEVIASTLAYGPSAAFAAGLIKVEYFSKFNVGLVWYYYNLWSVNYLLGFAGVIVCIVLLSNIVFGLMKRLIICIALFLINAPVIALSPLDGGNGFNTWKKSMVSYIISAYGAIIGMNLFFLILPVLQSISFFNIKFLDKLFNLLIVIAGFTMIKKFTALISSFIGATNLNDEGASTKKGVGQIATQGAQKTLAAANLGVKLGAYAMTGGVFGGAISKIHSHRVGRKSLEKDGVMLSLMSRKDREKMIKERAQQIKQNKKTARQAKMAKLGGGVINKLNAAAGTTLGRAALTYTGISPGPIFERRETETLPDGTTRTMTAKESRRAKGAKRLQAAKERVIDLNGMVFNIVGDTTNLSAAYKNLKENGVIDEGKLVLQGAYQAAGGTISSKSKLNTEKQKEENKKKSEKEYRENLERQATQSALAANEVFKITEEIKRR